MPIKIENIEFINTVGWQAEPMQQHVWACHSEIRTLRIEKKLSADRCAELERQLADAQLKLTVADANGRLHRFDQVPALQAQVKELSDALRSISTLPPCEWVEINATWKAKAALAKLGEGREQT